jgi:inner membrane transporter RhtA
VTIEFLGPLTLATVLSRRARDVGAVLAAAAGVVLISEVLHTSWRDLEWGGLGLAALAGACWAAYIVASRHAGREFEQLEGLALAMGVALLVALPFGVGSMGSWSRESVLKGLGIAVLSSVLPYSFELAALRRLSPRVFGVLLSLEPAAAAVAGLLLLGQRLATVQVAGMALVVAASALVLGSPGQEPPTGQEAAGA